MGAFSGLDDEVREEQVTEQVAPEKKKRAPFAYWEVGGREHKLKLKTATVCQLEEKYRGNLLNIVMGEGIPPLAIMLTVIQGAMKEWEHGVQFKHVQQMFDQYCEEGGTQMTLFTDVIIPIMSVSGFFTETQAAEMSEKVGEAREMM